MNKKRQKNKGITLIALVITIIVLLILAGVTIATLTGDNGILTKATSAALETDLAGIEEAANLAYASKLMGDTSLVDVSMADIVSQLQKEGYEIYSKQSSSGTITGIELDSSSLSITKGENGTINVTFKGNEEGIEYYAVVNGKYYLMSMTENGIKISREASDVDGSEEETLTASSNDESAVKVEEISGNTIKLKAGNTAGKTATITVTYGSYTAECVVTVVTTPTEDSVADAGVSFSTAYGTIDVIWLTEGNQISSTPNAPELTANGESMTPVTWTYDEGSKTWTEDATANTSNWYSYKGVSTRDENGPVDNTTSKWANAKTANGSYFVWIPRYAYRITYYSSQSSTEPTGYYDGWGMWRNDGTVKYKIDEGIETVDYNGNKYIVHPAFCDGKDNGYANGEWDKDLAGFWFAKYEMSNSSDLQSVPNVNELYGSVGTQYERVRNATYGYTGTEISITSGGNEYTHTNYMDSHMAKNSEWGAVAYLTQSQYGRNGNEISVNQCSGYYTGTGRGEGDNKIYNSTYSWSSITDAQKYNGSIGVLSSTTGNVYGVYDMSGGDWEYTAGFDKLGNSTYIEGSSYGLKMTQEAKDGEGNYTSTKYVTAYENGTSSSVNNAYDICKIGDAIKEVRLGNNTSTAWFSDYSSFAYSSYPFFERGGDYGNTNSAGVFYSCNSSGSGSYECRAVLCP